MTTLSGSVGQGGRNNRDDIIKVQELLNRVPEPSGGPRVRLTPDGICGPLTLLAIKKFQWRQVLPPRAPQTLPDGRVDPNGRSLQKLDEFALGSAVPFSPPPGTRGVEIPLLFIDMLDLIRRKHTREVDTFPPELLIGLFWEETNFINRRGIRNPSALGFGQVLQSNLEALHRDFGTSSLAEDILGAGNFERSVELASAALASALRVRRDRESALHYYATGSLTGHNPQVPKWLRCMTRLQSLRLTVGGPPPTVDDVGIAIREILWRTQHVLFSPDLVFR